MGSIGVLAINPETKEQPHDFTKTVQLATRFFPSETWDNIEYLGEIDASCDVRILVGKTVREAFLFRRLVEKVNMFRKRSKWFNVLLGITAGPIVATHWCFDGIRFKRVSYLVVDYVAKSVGIVSFYQVEGEFPAKVVAHGLGHSRGLRHHTEPVDVMYSDLLRASMLHVEGFCEACKREIANTHSHD
jgi:predicted Zn-dependent protease